MRNPPKWFGSTSTKNGFVDAVARTLKRRWPRTDLVTPYWRNGFVDWLVFDATLDETGAWVHEVRKDAVVCEAAASGVQTDGICLSAWFEIPTSELSPEQVGDLAACMVRDVEYPVYGILWPKDAPRGPFKRKYITKLEWWYEPEFERRDEEEEGR